MVNSQVDTNELCSALLEEHLDDFYEVASRAGMELHDLLLGKINEKFLGVRYIHWWIGDTLRQKESLEGRPRFGVLWRALKKVPGWESIESADVIICAAEQMQSHLERLMRSSTFDAEVVTNAVHFCFDLSMGAVRTGQVWTVS